MNICMIAYTFYEIDHRVRRYAEALAERGDRVDVMALQRTNEPRVEMINGVRLFRIQHRSVNEKTKLGYLAKICLFTARAFAFVTRGHLRNPYQLIHVHSIPDFEVFAAVVPKLTGAKIILDIHDVVPELYASKFKSGNKSLGFKMLVSLERLSARFADHVIIANHIWQERIEQRSVPKGKCTTLLNFANTRLFQRRAPRCPRDCCMILYPGSLSYHQGLDLAVSAFAEIDNLVPEAQLHIYGSGDQFDNLRQLIAELGLQGRVVLSEPVPVEEIIRLMENAAIGVVPKRKDGFGNEAFSTKIFEFMAMGVPVIAPDTMIDRYYFSDAVVRFFSANDANSLAEAMLDLIKHPEHRRELTANASRFVQAYTWEAHKDIYLRLVDDLVKARPHSRQGGHPDSAADSFAEEVRQEKASAVAYED